MADREQKCEGCQRSVCGDLDKLVCGHCLCRECSCNLDSLNRLCPVCMTCVSDNVEILSDKDIVLSDKELAMEISDKDEMDIAQVECVETNDHEVECEKEIMEDVKGSDISGLVDPKITLCQRITGALVTANESFRQLDTALETLKHLEDQIKQNEDNATKAVKQEFLKFAYLLNTRKLHLIGEIHRQTDVYAAAIAKAVDNIMEKKAGLEARVTIAKTVLKSPSESVYCNLDQLVKLLKVNVESDCLVSDSLMKGFNVRVLFDDEADSQNFEKIGKLCSDQLEIGQGDSSYVDLTVDGNSSTCSLVSSYMRGSDGRQVEVECEMEGGKRSYFEEKSCSLKKLDSPASHNAVAVFPQSLRDPDVIIEEIIDDSDSAYSDVNDSFQTNRTKDISQRTPHLNKAIGRIQNRPKTLKNPRVKSPTMKDFQENVQLVHVINPCHFYVHRIAHKKSLLMLERTLKALGQSPNSCSQSDTLVIGEMVVFYSAECNLWCRGRIVELIPLESKYKGTIYPVSYKMEDIYQMKVFLLDYGSCEVFSISRMTRSHLAKNETVFRSIVDLCLILRKLDQNSYLGRTPPFAVQCSLMGIVPQNSEEQWSKEATEEMLKMFKKKSVTMKVFRKEDDKLIVDLRKPSINTANSDTPASLRDALLFLDLARIGSQVPNAETRIKMLQYPKPVLPEEAAQVEVLVCNTNDPSDFYIHVLACSQYLNIVRKIQEIYSREESGEFEVLSPVMGQPCIAQYEDEDWYRGEVVGRPNQHEVEIRFVDFGNITRVNVGKLRSITEELLRIPCQAVCCRLANIQPIDSAPQWSVHACEEFGKVATDKRLKCTVIGVLMDKKLSIELYEDDPRNLNSINTILVKKDLASFICCDGMILNQHPTSEVWDPPSDVLSETFEDGVDMMALLEHKALFVVVSHVVSPSSIFVQWKSAENFIKSFQETLNDRYENTPPENKEWCVAMYVAVKHSSSKQWRRGMIENLVEKGVEVFLYDFGNKEVIDVSHIRTLDESHKLYGAFCLECSLIDIKPSGGCTEWTKTACEVLSFYLKGAEVTVVIEESTSKWPLPVKMTCNDEAGQLVDISSFLVRQGLALKERRPHKSDAFMEVNESLQEVTVDHNSNMVETGCDLETDQASLPINCTNNVQETEETITKEILNDPYLAPIIPDSEIFMANVTHVTPNGIIYVVHDLLENELGNLMSDVQQYLKGPGLLMPYSWTKGEGCLIKGPDDTSYRGKVLEIVGGDMIKVQYEDFGYIETILKCHLHPYTFRPNIPRFCIPCQLCNVLPVGEKWQPDAIDLLKELLVNRPVRVHLVEPPKCPGDAALVYLYCDDASVASILELHAHCSIEDREKAKEQKDLYENSLKKTGYTEPKKNRFRLSHLTEIFDLGAERLLSPDMETPLLSGYASTSLPHAGELFPISITHLETPNTFFITLKDPGFEDTTEETLASCLEKVNLEDEDLKRLTDFRPEMPCLSRFHDGKLYRAKLKSIRTYDPVSLLLQFVDYGSDAVVQSDSVFQIPADLIKYPARAIKVKMAGFKPPVNDFETVRIPYSPDWSMKALYKLMEIIEENTALSASCTATSKGDIATVFIYDDHQQLLHKQLVSMGFADYC